MWIWILKKAINVAFLRITHKALHASDRAVCFLCDSQALLKQRTRPSSPFNALEFVWTPGWLPVCGTMTEVEDWTLQTLQEDASDFEVQREKSFIDFVGLTVQYTAISLPNLYPSLDPLHMLSFEFAWNENSSRPEIRLACLPRTPLW